MNRIQRILSLIMISGLISVISLNVHAQEEKGNADKVKGKEKKELNDDQKSRPKASEDHQRDTARFHRDKPEEDRGNAETKGRPHGERPEPGKGGPPHDLKKDSPRHEMGKGRPGTETEAETERAKDAENVRKAHAYGKDKGELEGKKFGQSRAEQARMEQHKKEFELGTSVVEGEAKVKESREKIAAAKEKMEKDKKEKKISEAEYKEKKEKIEKAEKAVDDLEMQVKKAKEMKKK